MLTRVPFMDLPAQIRSLRPQLLEAAARVLDSGIFCLGPEVKAFEEEFAGAHGVAYGVGMNSGTSALQLALQAAGVEAGDEVICPAMTFVATASAIRCLGARPVYAEVDPLTATLDPNAAAAAITPRTRAIVAVHLYGQLAPMEALQSLAQRHGVALIEDACQAHLARRNGRWAGQFGLASAFSFYPGKNLGACGEAGILLTDDAALAETARRLRDWGQARKYEHTEFGYNFRMDAMQGALLRVKLPHLAGWTQRRQQHAQRYAQLLAAMPLRLPTVGEGNEHVYHLFAVGVQERDRVRAALSDRGVDCGIHYPIPVHCQPAFGDPQFPPGSLPVTEKLAAETLSLPMYAELTADQQERVAQALQEVL